MEQLYIKFNDNWQEVEIPKQSGIILNFTPFDSNNPTAYISEYSYNITIPHTKGNDLVFRNLQTLDSIGNSDITQRKFEYHYLIDSNLISAGDGQLVGWNEKGFNVQLNGALFQILTILSNLDFDDTKENYLTDYLKEWGVKLNAKYISDGWAMEAPELSFYNVINSGILTDSQKTNSFVQFVPTWSGVYNSFNSSQEMNANNEYKPTLEGSTYEGQELNQFQKSEIRSYYTTPVIYVNKLIQMFQDKALSLGWSFDLDSTFFSHDNPNYTDVVYTLPTQFQDGDVDGVVMDEGALTITNNSVGYTLPLGEIRRETYSVNPLFEQSNKTQYYQITTGLGGSIKAVGNPVGGVVADDWLMVNNANYITLKFIVRNADNSVNYEVSKYAFTFLSNQQKNNTFRGEATLALLDGLERGLSDAGYKIVRNIYNAPHITSGLTQISFESLGITETIPINNFSEPMFIDVVWAVGVPSKQLVMVGREEEVSLGEHREEYIIRLYDNNANSNVETIKQINIINKAVSRSNVPITLQSLFSKETPFSVVLKYTKLFNLDWGVDEVQKTITIKPKRLNIENPLDLSDRINKSTINQSTIINKRYLTFNYDGVEADLLKPYQENNGVVWGSKRIETPCMINDDEQKILEGFKVSATITPTYIPERNFKDGSLRTTATDEVFILNSNGNKTANISGAFYYRNPNKDWDTFTHPNGVKLTDDSMVEKMNNVYCWHKEGGRTTTQYPEISEVGRNGQRITFAVPKVKFSDVPDGVDLYDNFWRWWIEKINNSDNRKLKVEGVLPYADYLAIKNGQNIARIENQIAFISAISWKEEKCQIELILLK